jgi:transposase InsO family protein
VRISALVFARWAQRRGLSVAQIADRIGMDASTLRDWMDRWKSDHLRAKARGRPVDPVDADQLFSVLMVFGVIGPQVGLPTLQKLLPDMARAALISLQARCRAIYRKKAAWIVDTLRWTCPGAVWAIDFAQPPETIERIYTHLLIVRDLASGKVLLAIPTPGESATLVITVLASLFRWFGAPLVLKLDNGGPFITDELKDLLRQHGVLPLYSPPRLPRYNGSVEAGIGSIKTRAFWRAALAARPGQWTVDDIEAAVCEANTEGRPRGSDAPSPDDAWLSRIPITQAQRDALHARYAALAAEEYARRGLPPMTRLQHQEQASIDRVAISHALIDNGFLLIRRRRITPPVSRLRTRKIS